MKHSQTKFKPVVPLSRFYEGSYGRMFPELAGWRPTSQSFKEAQDKVRILSKKMRESEHSSVDEAHIIGIRKYLEHKFDSDLPAGYVYFGQFIVHDMTFDPTTLQMRHRDPNALRNFRTPSLDLDSVYGGGPHVQPYLYDPDSPGKFLINKFQDGNRYFFDHKRTTSQGKGDAIIADPRNDENLILSQLHLAFLLAHNKLVDKAISMSLANPFEEARRTMTWLYQFMLWNDFVAKITLQGVFDVALKKVSNSGLVTEWEAGFQSLFDWKHQPFIPIEFSMAAFRLGHSMSRPSYQLNSGEKGPNVSNPLFSTDPKQYLDLRGRRHIRKSDHVQWDWFFHLGNQSPDFPQKARRIDTFLSSSMFELPAETSGILGESNLAFIDLMRGMEFELPAGSAVAARLGIEPIDIDKDEDSLWYYILMEAQTQEKGERLGKVGSIIVCATIAGLLLGDPSSFFKQMPDWTPDRDRLLEDSNSKINGTWGIASIFLLAGLDHANIGVPANTSFKSRYKEMLKRVHETKLLRFLRSRKIQGSSAISKKPGRGSSIQAP